jgi:nanoRNase/pAp phosphatase (c-di-AMP/oligoRNAs hydrolase)
MAQSILPVDDVPLKLARKRPCSSSFLVVVSLLSTTASAFQTPPSFIHQRRDDRNVVPLRHRRCTFLFGRKKKKKGGSDSDAAPDNCNDGRSNSHQERPFGTYSARFLEDNGLTITTDEDGYITVKAPHELDHNNDAVRTSKELVNETFHRPYALSFDEASEEEHLDIITNPSEEDDDAFFDDFDDFDYTFLKDLDATQNTVLRGEPVVVIPKMPLTSSSFSERVTTGSSEIVPAKALTNNIKISRPPPPLKEQPVQLQPLTGFNVVLTHCTADFDSLASAVGLAKLWSAQANSDPQLQPTESATPTTTSRSDETNDTATNHDSKPKKAFDSMDSQNFPTFVVLPRGAHPSVQRFLALHKHLFPIRSLKSLPPDLSKLNRLALVDAQRRDRIGPAATLLEHANRVVIVDHHVDMESDIQEVTDYVVDKVGSVSTLIVERLMKQQQEQQLLMVNGDVDAQPFTLTEAEATLLALGIHADTGSLCFDSTTPRDATALAWVMSQGASQVAIAEHAQSSLSQEQQGVLTQALVKTNSTVAHGVTISTVLLTADGFIQGLAAVTQDALELSSSDVYLLGLVYEPKAGGQRKKNKAQPGERIKSRLLIGKPIQEDETPLDLLPRQDQSTEETIVERRRRLQAAFDRKDLDGSGCLNRNELSAALAAAGIVATEDTINGLMEVMDKNQDGRVDFEEFVKFANDVQSANEKRIEKREENEGSTVSEDPSKSTRSPSPSSTLIIIGRAKPGVNLKSVNLGKMLETYGGGGHAKAASATVRLNDETEAAGILSGLVDELIKTSLQAQPTVGDFMTSPVLSVKPDMTEKQVEDLFTRYDVRALPVVNEDNDVIGLVTYKEVAAAKQRMWNKEQKRLKDEAKRQSDTSKTDESVEKQTLAEKRRQSGSTVKAWMKQHITTVEASMTMAEVEAILLANDVGCIPVVQDGTNQLVGMLTRTDLLRQHRYYKQLHYNNKGMSDSIAARKPIIALRKKLKQFDLDE